MATIGGAAFRSSALFKQLLLVPLSLSLLLASGVTIDAGTFRVFGQKTYKRAAGDPAAVQDSFNVRDATAPYSLFVYNGGLVDSEVGELVSGSSLTLNGVMIVGPSNFNQKTTVLNLPVSLLQSNQLCSFLRRDAWLLYFTALFQITNNFA